MGALVKIQTVTVGAGGQANIQFSSIPQTYTDLFIVARTRTNRANVLDAFSLYFNSDTTAANYNLVQTYGVGNTAGGQTNKTNSYLDELCYTTGNSASATYFGTSYLRIPGYTSSFAKAVSTLSAGTDPTVGSNRANIGGLYWSGTAAISTITLVPITGTLFTQYSTATLYGTVANVGGTGSKATGGTVTTAGGYTYHTFTASGTLIPTTNISNAEVLIVAGGGGGGGGGSWAAGGGGAGGLIYASGLSLTSGTKYGAIVGAGGVGGYGVQCGANGGNSSFGTQTVALGGGGGGGYQGGGATTYSAQSGGSGGGGPSGQSYGGSEAGASGTAGQGNSGGTGWYNPVMGGGGGGGAGAAGGSGASAGGTGGAGVNTYSAWGSATGTGHLLNSVYWYAGGGGGSSGGTSFTAGNRGGQGGNGGGGFGAPDASYYGSNGLPYTGGGGGGHTRQLSSTQGAGGSGVVIVRYTT